MLHQQINDSAITSHNWLSDKGYDILSIHSAALSHNFLLFVASMSGELYLPSPLIPHFLFSFLLACPWRGPLFLLSFYLKSKASGKQALSLPLFITFNCPDIYSTLCPFHNLCTSFATTLCPTCPALYVLAYKHTTAIRALHLYTSSSFQLSSFSASCHSLMPLPLIYSLCL